MSVWLAHLTLKYCEEQPTNANCKTAAEAKVENELQHAATSRIRWQMMPAQKTNPLPNHLDAFLVWRPLVLRVPVSPSRGCRAALVKADEDSDSAAVDAGLPILVNLKWCRCNPKPNQQVSSPCCHSEAKAANSASRSLKTNQSHSKTCRHWGPVG